MTANTVVDLYKQAEQAGIIIWIDGGWCVDALLEKLTRPHGDLDIAIQEKDVERFRQILKKSGYEDVFNEDRKAWNFIMEDEQNNKVDFHVIILDAKGNGMYGPVEKGEMYPAASLTGRGTILQHLVRCISPEWLIKFHTGYTLRPTDYQDVTALCEKFKIPLPEEYKT